MSEKRFSISVAVAQAYRFVWQERFYLLKAGLAPLGVNVLTIFLLSPYLDKTTALEEFLWTLPYTVFCAWFMFTETRLILFGEHLLNLPTDPAYMAARRNCLQASIIIWVLFNMGLAAILSYLSWSSRMSLSGQDPNALMTTFAMLLIGGSFWGIRLAPLHILAAIGYPIRRYLREAEGVFISLRLLGLGFVAALPLLTAVHFILAGTGTMLQNLTPDRFVTLSLLLAPLSIVLIALLNAAAVFALREMLGKNDDDGKLRRAA